jgi:hypothetical protein
MVNDEYVKDLQDGCGLCESQRCNYHISRVCKAQGPTNIESPQALRNKALSVHELSTTHCSGKFEHIRGNSKKKKKKETKGFNKQLYLTKHGLFTEILHTVAM